MLKLSDRNFINEILKLHNNYRTKHWAPNLKVDKKLNESAQHWAQTIAKVDRLNHKPSNVYGENLYVASSTDPHWRIQPKMIMESWYDEHKLYNYNHKTPRDFNKVGHFTQIVWSETRLLGVGIATSKTKNVYVVCHYYPPGNITGQFIQHVRSPKDKGDVGRNASQVSIETLEDLEVIPSLEKLGIRPKAPANAETIEKLNRKYELPTERFYAWLSWLMQVTEEGKKWQKWLKIRITFIQTILNILTGDILIPGELSYGNNYRRENELPAPASKEEAKEDEIVPDGDEEKSSKLRGEINRTQDELLRSESADKKNKSLALVEEEPTSPSQPPQATVVVNEKLNGVTDNAHQWMNEENTSEVLGTLEGFDEIPWPIGVPWVPQEFDKNKKPKHKQKELKLTQQKKPSPRNEKEMIKVIKRMKHQAIIYRSLYKHWKDVTYQAHKQIVDEQSTSENHTPDRPPTNEKIPYFFYLYNPPDVDSAIERDDRAIVLGNVTREKISRENSPECFNSMDKTQTECKPRV